MLRREFLAGLMLIRKPTPIQNTQKEPSLFEILDALKVALSRDPLIGEFEVHYNPMSPAVLVIAAFQNALPGLPEEDGDYV